MMREREISKLHERRERMSVQVLIKLEFNENDMNVCLDFREGRSGDGSDE